MNDRIKFCKDCLFFDNKDHYQRCNNAEVNYHHYESEFFTNGIGVPVYTARAERKRYGLFEVSPAGACGKDAKYFEHKGAPDKQKES